MLNEKQKHAYDAMAAGKNVFLSGEAGTGKSYVLNQFIADFGSDDTIVCAPTGIAAINIGGATIHRTFKAPIGPIVDEPYSASEVVQKAKRIIIDEISMCRTDLFDFVAKSILLGIEQAKEYGEGAIEKQLIVVGDFYQLPPVLTDEDREVLGDSISEGYAFQSEYWAKFNFETVVLDEIVRQKDFDFVTNLNLIRRGDAAGLDWINQYAAKDEFRNGITLCSTNSQAYKANKAQLDKLPGYGKRYESIDVGEVTDSDRVAERVLYLKKGARVMMVINDQEGQYQNGTTGTVVDLSPGEIDVKLDNGKEITVYRHKWEIERYEIVTKSTVENGKTVQKKKLVKKTIGSYEQFPMKIGYAITIHKSQGKTYEQVNLHPNCFAAGQLYVALSRVTSIEGLYLTSKIKKDYLITSAAVQRFYNDSENIEIVTKSKLQHGGKREGAGRKQRYGCKTVTMRVPEHLQDEIRAFIESRL